MLLLLVTCMLLSAYLAHYITRKWYMTREQELMRHRRITTSGYIYFVQLVSGHRTLVKIGRSVDPIKRIRALRTSAPYGIKVLGIMPTFDDVASERMIHQRFAHLRVSDGNEWFRMSIPLLTFIHQVSDKSATAAVRKGLSNVRGSRGVRKTGQL